MHGFKLASKWKCNFQQNIVPTKQCFLKNWVDKLCFSSSTLPSSSHWKQNGKQRSRESYCMKSDPHGPFASKRRRFPLPYMEMFYTSFRQWPHAKKCMTSVLRESHYLACTWLWAQTQWTFLSEPTLSLSQGKIRILSTPRMPISMPFYGMMWLNKSAIVLNREKRVDHDR